MKRLFFVGAVALLMARCGTADSKTVLSADALKDSGNYTSIQWIDSVSQNLGNVKQGQVAEITWHFKNSGNKPLVIQDVRPGCGCTVADKPEEPIMPGKEGVIKAKFDSHGQYEGEHYKNLTVYSNTQNTMQQLQFRVQVMK